MMKFIFLMVVIVLTSNVECIEQKCKSFSEGGYSDNTYDGNRKTFYVCYIDGNLTNRNETVITDTSLNEKSNSEVTLVFYNTNNILKFIPNSLFTTFINLEYLWIYDGNKFETIHSDYFKNANKLTKFHVKNNNIKKLEQNLFIEAQNLEHINLEHNEIESIHKSAFSGLPNLQGVYLQGNQIQNLNPSTFSKITKLNILELSNNTCVKEKYVNANQKVSIIETAIQKSCTYNSEEEIRRITNISETLKVEKNNFEEKLRIANKVNEDNQRKLREIEEKVKIINAETIQHKLESTLASQIISKFSTIIEVFTENDKKCSTKQEIDAKTIEELNEKLKKIESQASFAEIQDKLQAKIRMEIEAKFDAKLANQKIEIQNIELSCSNIHLALVEKIQDQKDASQKCCEETLATGERNNQNINI